MALIPWIRLFLLLIFFAAFVAVVCTAYDGFYSLGDPKKQYPLLELVDFEKLFDEQNGGLFREKAAPQFISDPIEACGFNLVLVEQRWPYRPAGYEDWSDPTHHPLAMCPTYPDDGPTINPTHLSGRPSVVELEGHEKKLTAFDFMGLRTLMPDLHPTDPNPCPLPSREALRAGGEQKNTTAEEQQCANEAIGRLLAKVGRCATYDWTRRIHSTTEPNCTSALAEHESKPWYEQKWIEGDKGARAQTILYNAMRTRASEIEFNVFMDTVYKEIPLVFVLFISFFMFFALPRLFRTP